MKNKSKKQIKVGIIMGSDSDLEVMSEAEKILETFSVAYEISVVSAHRTPDVLFAYGMTAEKRGLGVIIAGAGGSAHLPGMIASLTNIPVIGVPIKTKTMEGIDSLLSIAQMPPGIPVATVAINGAKNAGLLAIQIFALNNKNLKNKLVRYKKSMSQEVKQKSTRLKKLGFKKYLKK